MAKQNLWQRLLAAVNREYERRVRAASLVAEYGSPQHAAPHEDDEGEVAVIANVPRGTRLSRHPSADPPTSPE